MNILYDHQTFTISNYGGISKYHIELIKNLSNYEDVSCDLVCKVSNNENLIRSKIFPISPFFRDTDFKGKGRLMNAINKAYTKRAFSKKHFDVFHPTYYDDYFFPYLRRDVPYVITCHDLIHEKFSGIYPSLKGDIFHKKSKKEILVRSAAIITVSQNTKEDIVGYYDIDPNKISVIHLAHEQEQVFNSCEKSLFSFEYLLFVGNRTLYKNFSFFIKSLCNVLKQYPDLRLICAGGGNFTKEESILLQQLNLDGKVFHHPMNEHYLPILYKHAIAFFFPSIYEGFGIPVLEAFCNGCPTVLSNKGSLPEVGQNAALYFDPTNAESIRDVAEKVIQDSACREALRQKGFERYKDFSWKKTAEQTLQVYKALV